jgi:hypothetical protein
VRGDRPGAREGVKEPLLAVIRADVDDRCRDDVVQLIYTVFITAMMVRSKGDKIR